MPNAHILQTWDWGAFKHQTTGWKPHRWAFTQNGETVAMASVGARSIGPLKVMYAPKGPAMRYDDPALVEEVLSLLQMKARTMYAVTLKIDPDVNLATGKPGSDDDTPHPAGQHLRETLQQMGWRFSDEQIQFRNTVTIDLTEDEDDLLMAMSGNTRRKVRLAYRRDVTVRSATPDDLDTLYRLYETTGDRNDFLVRPKAYYATLWREFMERDLAHALIAEYNGQPIAHVILFHFGKTCWYFFGASSNAERNRMPNYALQWEAIKWAQSRGYEVYDMWGAPDVFDDSDEMWGVYRFKRGFRGTVERRPGAWDYAPYPLLYNAYKHSYPRLLDWMRNRRSE